jgi:hypothetical protein
MLCCQGACFRDLPGVRVRPDNTVEWDPNVEREYLPSGKPLVKNLLLYFFCHSIFTTISQDFNLITQILQSFFVISFNDIFFCYMYFRYRIMP